MQEKPWYRKRPTNTSLKHKWSSILTHKNMPHSHFVINIRRVANWLSSCFSQASVFICFTCIFSMSPYPLGNHGDYLIATKLFYVYKYTNSVSAKNYSCFYVYVWNKSPTVTKDKLQNWPVSNLSVCKLSFEHLVKATKSFNSWVLLLFFSWLFCF